MKSLAREYRNYYGIEKEKIKDDLKQKTSRKFKCSFISCTIRKIK